MDREKQIEEMAKCCIYHDNGKCNADITEDNECDLMCKMFGTFTNLEMADYRKQIEVAREIFEEIDNIIYNLRDSPFYSSSDAVDELTELKKKYTGEKEDDKVCRP